MLSRTFARLITLSLLIVLGGRSPLRAESFDRLPPPESRLTGSATAPRPFERQLQRIPPSAEAIRRIDYVEFIQSTENSAYQPDRPTFDDAPAYDTGLVSRGQAAFNSSCTDCHEAQRSFSKSKSLAGWRATVQRMAAKDGSSVAPGDIESIANYLASQSGASGNGGAAADGGKLGGGDAVSIFATISPVYREADALNGIENPGFFADAWVGAEWRPSGPLSGRVTACTSCHNTRQGLELELAEALIELNLTDAFFGSGASDCAAVRSKVTAGRLIVPFGAFSATAHPGANRAVTNPLMYNMGRRVFGNVGPPRQPVLPMPYADEGADLEFRVQLLHDWMATLDLYAINGLQAGASAPMIGATSVFFTSRAYSDNNSKLAFGGRATVGNEFVRFGGSAMSGELQADGAPRQNYSIAGVDVSANYEDLIRMTFEYATRSEEVPGNPRNNLVYGIVASGEVRVYNRPKIYLFGRYDTLEYRDTLGPDAGVERYTWGFNIPTPGATLLSLNHEHWIFPAPQQDVDVVGARWTAAF